MDGRDIAKELRFITNSRLNTISMEYGVDAVTSNVSKLHKELKKALDSKRIKIIEGANAVTSEELQDMFDMVDRAINFYKTKYKRKTFPRDLYFYELIENLTEMKPEEIVRFALRMDKPNVTKKQNKKMKIDFEALIEAEMKMGLF
ncbi:hypothetical protein [Sphingobacterium sp.]|uniref:hypothetical protein n=1 Tax=Sphingobacterium sp. TaxID=341027 RepID=UPI0028A93FDF|nr:hypothetical protein [Sphingobacterium sp.]